MGHFIRIVYFAVAFGDWFDVVTNCTIVVVLRLLAITRLRARGCSCAFTAVKRVSLFFSF